MQFIYIETQQALSDYCQQISSDDILAVDTEFVRTRTLFPNLGLIQAYDGKQLALIDPVAVDDLSPFWQLLADESICKIIHSCSEDLEVFMHSGNCKPKNMIDSQIIMSFLGHGLSMGYAAMIKHFLDIDVDKSESRTDWMKRPLSSKQLDYAAADVLYLHQISQTLLTQIEQAGWLKQAKIETEQQIDKKFKKVDLEALYLDFKQAWKLTPAQLLILQQLLIWRYQQAVKRNLPLSFVAKDHTLFLIAQRNPNNVGAMAHYDGIDILDIRHKGKAMLAVVREANKLPEQQYPAHITRLDNYPGYKQIFKTFKNYVATLASEQQLDMSVVAGKKQLNQFLSWFWQLNDQHNRTHSVELLNGWRGELFADKLKAFAENGFA
ncbi:ribonuclease D [Thalassomonas sp. M1454]|uniref:ribonuclease D n=1 Tax=Thalassomonas sp. M1454 TaxID=2594477 RepID=UPI00117CED73|nr:ribonuclease D [Thalassomonas sp. M1454]TRX57125.1 ribonuclease D [Thalassomonas sp. M1454]